MVPAHLFPDATDRSFDHWTTDLSPIQVPGIDSFAHLLSVDDLQVQISHIFIEGVGRCPFL